MEKPLGSRSACIPPVKHVTYLKQNSSNFTEFSIAERVQNGASSLQQTIAKVKSNETLDITCKLTMTVLCPFCHKNMGFRWRWRFGLLDLPFVFIRNRYWSYIQAQWFHWIQGFMFSDLRLLNAKRGRITLLKDGDWRGHDFQETHCLKTTGPNLIRKLDPWPMCLLG